AGEADQLLGRVRQGHLHHAAAPRQTLEVVERAEQVELLVLGVPVPADALEAARAVVQRVGYDAYLRLRQRHELVAEIGVGVHLLVTSAMSPRGRAGAALPERSRADYTGRRAGAAKRRGRAPAVA